MLHKIAEPTVNEENKIESIANSLYNRIAEETERLLKSQLEILGVEFPKRKLGASEYYDYAGIGLKKITFPDDDKALAVFEYGGRKILGIRISDNQMCIEFDIPDLLIQKWIERVDAVCAQNEESQGGS